ncbi:MAG TPA: hypothetical protein VK988_19820 [Acidimicrobiales bacterium]|nr:hypothetical protein [Acidimicrobiales bacterium]
MDVDDGGAEADEPLDVGVVGIGTHQEVEVDAALDGLGNSPDVCR